jgi:hypothetical protein
MKIKQSHDTIENQNSDLPACRTLSQKLRPSQSEYKTGSNSGICKEKHSQQIFLQVERQIYYEILLTFIKHFKHFTHHT